MAPRLRGTVTDLYAFALSPMPTKTLATPADNHTVGGEYAAVMETMTPQ